MASKQAPRVFRVLRHPYAARKDPASYIELGQAFADHEGSLPYGAVLAKGDIAISYERTLSSDEVARVEVWFTRHFPTLEVESTAGGETGNG